jgi:hypothetical protein
MHYSRNMWLSVVLLKCDVVGLSLDERNDKAEQFHPDSVYWSDFRGQQPMVFCHVLL